MSAILRNSAGVLVWGILSALGVSGLILASQLAFDALRVVGAAVLIVMGLRSLCRRYRSEERATADKPQRARWWSGLVTSVSNPKLAVFFVALFPQFLTRGSPVLPYALAMAGVIVLVDVLWFSTLAFTVDRARTLLKPRVQRGMERFTGAVMIGLGVRLATESR
jgi:threonine/homoserine/homoserine lactone efflux protein